MKAFLSVLLLLPLLVGCDNLFGGGDDAETESTIVEVAEADGRFTTLVSALETAELTETLEGEGPYTVFAPTDEAFELLPEGTLEALMDDVPTLRNILLYHVVPGELTAEEIEELEVAQTELGEEVEITVDEEGVLVNDARLVVTNLEASNGIIHVIDAVLLPPEA